MTINQLAKLVCQREGKRKQVDIAQVKEIIGIISDIVYQEGLAKFPEFDTYWSIVTNGHKRAEAKAKKKKKKKR